MQACLKNLPPFLPSLLRLRCPHVARPDHHPEHDHAGDARCSWSWGYHQPQPKCNGKCFSIFEIAAVLTNALLQYINSTWWIFTGIIGLAMVLNLFSIFWAWRSRHALRRPPPPQSSDSENSRATTPGQGKASLRRLPNAILTSIRIVAFRWRVPFLSGTILELFLAFSYLAILFVYALIQSKLIISCGQYGHDH